MNLIKYRSGQEVLPGDRIVYHSQLAIVEFVVNEKTGDPAMDWYIDEFPGGGFMIRAPGFGSVFITDIDDEQEDLEFVSRGEA